MKTRKICSLILCILLVFAYCAVFCVSAEEDFSGATEFVFSDAGITVTVGEYTGYKVDGTSLTINESGIYRISGSCADGSVKVKKGTEGVTLVLAGLDLTSASTAPICCNKSTDVTIIAAEGTKNTLTDSEKNNDETYPANEDAENAVIKCKDGSDVTITGKGTLTLNAYGKNGIKSGATTEEEGEARLEISELTLVINAPVNDGINAEQLLEIKSGSLTVSAGDDGIHCDMMLYIGDENTEGPDITVEESYEGIEAAELYIRSGRITVHSTDDCLNAANSDLSGYAFKIEISGGELYMDTTAGDGIDSNGTLDISGGTVVVWTANRADNQPLDADGTINVSGGTVLAAGGSSGMGMKLGSGAGYVIFGGSGNAGGFPGGNGGFPGGGGGGMPGGNGGERPEMPSEMPSDMPDSGERPEMPSGAPDSGERPEMPSGAPSNGERPEMPGNGSESAASGSGTVSISKGDTITIEDSEGNTLYSGTALTDASYIFFSSADVVTGGDYKLLVNGSDSSSASGGGNGSGSGAGGSDNSAPAENDGSAAASDAVSSETAATSGSVPPVVYVLLGASGIMLVGGVAALVISKKKKTA